MQDYKSVVLQLIRKGQYPRLQDYIVLDLYYKCLPLNHNSDVVHAYHKKMHDPLDKLRFHTDPFHISYLVGGSHDQFYVHETESFPAVQNLPLHCQRIKLGRNYVDTVLQTTSASLEEELHQFLTLLNFQTPKLAPLLDMHTMTCTRLLPQYIDVWVHSFMPIDVKKNSIGATMKDYFGPDPHNDSLLPLRVLRGHLAPATSQKDLLSLNNDIEAKLDDLTYPFMQHYSDQWKCLVPLAYNPLENPIIV